MAGPSASTPSLPVNVLVPATVDSLAAGAEVDAEQYPHTAAMAAKLRQLVPALQAGLALNPGAAEALGPWCRSLGFFERSRPGSLERWRLPKPPSSSSV